LIDGDHGRLLHVKFSMEGRTLKDIPIPGDFGCVFNRLPIAPQPDNGLKLDAGIPRYGVLTTVTNKVILERLLKAKGYPFFRKERDA
jgi:hypothetical protein